MKFTIFNPFSFSTQQMKKHASYIDGSIEVRYEPITKFTRIKYGRLYFRENGYPNFGLKEVKDWVEMAYEEYGK